MASPDLEVAEVRILRRRRSYRAQFVGGLFLFGVFTLAAYAAWANGVDTQPMAGYLLGFVLL